MGINYTSPTYYSHVLKEHFPSSGLLLLKLIGTLPTSLGKLEHLQQLFVGSNHLNGTIPISLSKLEQLSSLSMQDNDLQGTIPEGLITLTRLKSLHLDHNNLTGTIPSTLGALALSLLDLTASDNLLTGSLPASLGRVAKRGRVVDFSYNRLHGEIPVELCLARNMFLIGTNITNRCSEICRDKQYRVSHGGGVMLYSVMYLYSPALIFKIFE